MKVYITMLYDHHEYHVGEVFYNKDDAYKEIEKDIMGFDYVVVKDVIGLP